ncbi:hypothetical protein EPN28_01630 [Patescibacteria group bacterium]|nr:MAG: hypothetical protein EPN28_01630 [Patescibacteria group bacterium]
MSLLWINGKALEFDCEAHNHDLVREILTSFVVDVLPAQWTRRWRWWPPGFERVLTIPHGDGWHYFFANTAEGAGVWFVCDKRDRAPVELLGETACFIRVREAASSPEIFRKAHRRTRGNKITPPTGHPTG